MMMEIEPERSKASNRQKSMKSRIKRKCVINLMETTKDQREKGTALHY